MTHEDIWWREYRKTVNRPDIRNMTTETIIRKVFKKTAKKYITHCSISGIRHLFSSQVHLSIRIMWLVLVIGLCFSIFYYLHSMAINNLAKPFIVTMDSSTYHISNIDFPAVALCNFNRISKRALENFVTARYNRLALHNESFGEVLWFTQQLGRLLDHTFNPALVTSPLFVSFAKYLGDTHNLSKLMYQLAPPCHDMLLKCSWSGEQVDCDSIFTVRRTAHGHCCAFNYILAYDSFSKPDQRLKMAERQKEPGLYHGLNVLLNPMAEDYTYSLFNMKGFEVLIFDPTHFADPSGGRVIQRLSQPGQAVFFELKSTKQTATAEVRKYSTTSRKCLFHDEAVQFNDMYSYSACIVNCRIRAMRALCKCTPFFLPTAPEDGPLCTLDNLKCLNKYREKLYRLYPIDAEGTTGLEREVHDALYCPDCLPDCEFTHHFTKHSRMPLKILKYDDKRRQTAFLSGVNRSEVCLLVVYQPTGDGVLNRLDVVLYWFEILSNIGGFGGMLMGFSTISVLEFLYLFVFGFFINYFSVYYGNNQGIHE